MILKDKDSTPYGGFVFYFKHVKTGEEVRVPSGKKSANGISQLTNLASSALRNNGMEVPENLSKIVEHQICLRQPEPKKVCFNGGIGDSIHHNVAKPFLLKVSKVAEKVGAKSVSKVAKAVGGCSYCGGTKTYEQGRNNLGRAGTLNKLNSGKFAINADYKK